MSMVYALLAVTLVVLFFTLHKVRRVHLMAFELRDRLQTLSNLELNQVFQQIQALEGLWTELKFSKSLPPTRGWSCSPDFLLAIALHALDHRPEFVVECSSGVSTIVLARSLQLNGRGHVYSLEHQSEYAEQTRLNLRRHGLESWATVLEAPLETVEIGGERFQWYPLESLPEGGIDLLVVDGPPAAAAPMARYPAGPFLLPRLNDGAAVFLDDAARDGEKAALVRWAEEFPELSREIRNFEKGCAVLTKCGKKE